MCLVTSGYLGMGRGGSAYQLVQSSAGPGRWATLEAGRRRRQPPEVSKHSGSAVNGRIRGGFP